MPDIPLVKFSDAVRSGRVEWQRHVLERMLERQVGRDNVLSVLLDGEIIENYPDDFPFASALVLGWIAGRPLHVVAALNKDARMVAIITVYEPSTEYFESDFKTRKTT